MSGKAAATSPIDQFDPYQSRTRFCGARYIRSPGLTANASWKAGWLPGLAFPNVRDMSVNDIWYTSEGFNRYRGDGWMRESCRTCPEKEKDLGGCRCQAFMLTGDATNADPVCGKSSHHHVVQAAVTFAQVPDSERSNAKPLVFRDPKQSRLLANARLIA